MNAHLFAPELVLLAGCLLAFGMTLTACRPQSLRNLSEDPKGRQPSLGRARPRAPLRRKRKLNLKRERADPITA